MAKKETGGSVPLPPSPPSAPEQTKKPDNIGADPVKISVELSTRFLEHFSEQLYSSPQKAFEELISNGWDAGAKYVDVRIATDLSDPAATLAVLDNGCSMDEAGLKALWYIASSPKKNISTLYGRPVIGKFGIGKLATYVLANKLAYRNNQCYRHRSEPFRMRYCSNSSPTVLSLGDTAETLERLVLAGQSTGCSCGNVESRHVQKQVCFVRVQLPHSSKDGSW